MNTVSGGEDRSLLFWRQNSNGSNVYATSFGGDTLTLKEHYLKFFRGLETELARRPFGSFVELWKKEVLKSCSDVTIAVGKVTSAENAKRVTDKFKGNLAEIFAEKLFADGHDGGLFKPGTYVPVEDPHHEEGIDASAVSAVSGLTVGIQVKNRSDAIGIETFRTAGDESDKFSHTLDPGKFGLFLSHPNQYILSFSNAKPMLENLYAGRVEFLGPAWIDGRGLQGRRGEKTGRWLFFKEIADEIESVRAV